MKKLVKSLLIASASLVAANSAVAGMIDDFCPYLGIDYKQRWMKDRHFSSINGNRNNSMYGGTIYLGSRSECFGLEAGLEFAGANRRNITFTDNDGDLARANVRPSLWGGYIDALAFAPIAECAEVFGGFGVGVLSAKTSYSTTTRDNHNFSSGGSRAAAVARLRLGLNYMVSECVGLRGAIGWESTENLALRQSDYIYGFGRHSAFSNSFTLQAGIFAKF